MILCTGMDLTPCICKASLIMIPSDLLFTALIQSAAFLRFCIPAGKPGIDTIHTGTLHRVPTGSLCGHKKNANEHKGGCKHAHIPNTASALQLEIPQTVVMRKTLRAQLPASDSGNSSLHTAKPIFSLLKIKRIKINILQTLMTLRLLAFVNTV